MGGGAFGGVLVGVAGFRLGTGGGRGELRRRGCAASGMRFPAVPAAAARESTLYQLREGWREFIAPRWLWSIVLEVTCMTAIIRGTLHVLGPVVADVRPGRAPRSGPILGSSGLGAVPGRIV